MIARTGVALFLAVLSALSLTASASETAAYWLEKGDSLLFQNGSEQDALIAYQKALDIEPHNESILLQMSVAYDILSVGKAVEALGIIETKLEQNPQDALSWQAKSVALHLLRETDEANKSAEKAIEIYDQEIQKDLTNGTAWFYKAENLANRYRLTDALPAYEKVIELDHPMKKYAWASKGAILQILGQYNGSLAAYDKALELDPEKALFWLGRAIACQEMGLDAEAEIALNKARELGYEY